MFYTKNKVITLWYQECQTKHFFSGCRQVEENNNDAAFLPALMFVFHIPLFRKKDLHSRSRILHLIYLCVLSVRQERITSCPVRKSALNLPDSKLLQSKNNS